ncbi:MULTISPECIES: hypothetical protein [unclassified Pseudomonas]|uniref:hypothetical protein n=1 Tax=unclassified Pseudomonas TaxID=196821 RepID=UPI00215E3F4C|nr:hypothetical protein [Pseudomonas sp. B21-015]UVM50145.1 hypothetical protein LOY38_28080 [Pseudomonas sp. B21-015]
MNETKIGKAALLPEVIFPRKMSTAWCAVAFEELATAIDFIEAGIEQTTPLQQKLWERYKAQTAQFAHDMLLAEGNLDEITRRLGLNDVNRPS